MCVSFASFALEAQASFKHFRTCFALLDSPLALCTQNTHITDSHFPSDAPLPAVFLHFISLSHVIYCLLHPSIKAHFHCETVIQEVQASPQFTVQLGTTCKS